MIVLQVNTENPYAETLLRLQVEVEMWDHGNDHKHGGRLRELMNRAIHEYFEWEKNN